MAVAQAWGVAVKSVSIVQVGEGVVHVEQYGKGAIDVDARAAETEGAVKNWIGVPRVTMITCCIMYS